MDRCDVLVVGAGFSGLTIAEQLASRFGQRVVVVDQRAHIGGNAFDTYNAAGVLVHQYGPHYFRTNSSRVRDYLSQFTAWRAAAYRIRSHTHGRDWSFPVNLETYEQLVGHESTPEAFRAYLERARVPIDHPANSEEKIISQVGWELYEMFFRGYTIKQWGREPRDLDASVCGRIPIRTTRDDRYVDDTFQAMPALGYTAMFETLLAGVANNVEVRLNTSFFTPATFARAHGLSWRHIVYTGSLDRYFQYCCGSLPYRSLRFEHQTLGPDEVTQCTSAGLPCYQARVQVNYPNSEAFTRVVEIKHVTGQAIDATTIVREYPTACGPGDEPYYPIPEESARRRAAEYAACAALVGNVSFIGRLARYRYYNMDQVVAMALHEADRIGPALGGFA